MDHLVELIDSPRQSLIHQLKFEKLVLPAGLEPASDCLKGIVISSWLTEA